MIPGGGQEGEGEGGGDEGYTVTRTMQRRRTSFVSFLSEKETKEIWPPPLLSISSRCYDGLYKQLNINMTIIHSLPLFIRTLTSAAQR